MLLSISSPVYRQNGASDIASTETRTSLPIYFLNFGSTYAIFEKQGIYIMHLKFVHTRGKAFRISYSKEGDPDSPERLVGMKTRIVSKSEKAKFPSGRHVKADLHIHGLSFRC